VTTYLIRATAFFGRMKPSPHHSEIDRHVRNRQTATPAMRRYFGRGNVQAPKEPMRAQVLIPKDLPPTQIEIEVIAFLLGDWESLFPIVAEAVE
jgi:hypothetical protein